MRLEHGILWCRADRTKIDSMPTAQPVRHLSARRRKYRWEVWKQPSGEVEDNHIISSGNASCACGELRGGQLVRHLYNSTYEEIYRD
jgi:hypothetical protein